MTLQSAYYSNARATNIVYRTLYRAILVTCTSDHVRWLILIGNVVTDMSTRTRRSIFFLRVVLCCSTWSSQRAFVSREQLLMTGTRKLVIRTFCSNIDTQSILHRVKISVTFPRPNCVFPIKKKKKKIIFPIQSYTNKRTWSDSAGISIRRTRFPNNTWVFIVSEYIAVARMALYQPPCTHVWHG